jgi:ferritin-like metal-binding protein YciE
MGRGAWIAGANGPSKALGINSTITINEEGMAHREQIISWLNDAYAMENGLIPILEIYAKDFQEYPAAQARIREHIEATRRHADLDRQLIDHLGGTVSRVTSSIG